MGAKKLGKNPTLLTLLAQEAFVVLPSGYKLEGHSKGQYIQKFNVLGAEDGRRVLSRAGVNLALNDAKQEALERAKQVT